MSPFAGNYSTYFLLVGCDEYDYLDNLSKVRSDLDLVKATLTHFDYGVFVEEQFEEIYNGTSEDLRAMIKDFLYTRSSERDILVFYFAGHGTAVGRDDFGFCMRDAFVHDTDNVILPTSIVKLSEIIDCLKIQNISPIIIVDACYSGQISREMVMQYIDIVPEMSKSLMMALASDFGLITACSDNQQIPDIGIAGLAIKDFCEQGLEEGGKEFLTFGDLAETLANRIESNGKGDTRSRVLIPPGRISKMDFCRNIQYTPPTAPITNYSFTNPYLKVLIALWNNGRQVSLTPAEILEQTGSQSAYANHNKLSYEHWALVKDNKIGERIITERGIQFLNGEIAIPKVVQVNRATKECTIAPDTDYIRVVEQENLFGGIEKALQTVAPE